jgi:hypothetical protein
MVDRIDASKNVGFFVQKFDVDEQKGSLVEGAVERYSKSFSDANGIVSKVSWVAFHLFEFLGSFVGISDLQRSNRAITKSMKDHGYESYTPYLLVDFARARNNQPSRFDILRSVADHLGKERALSSEDYRMLYYALCESEDVEQRFNELLSFIEKDGDLTAEEAQRHILDCYGLLLGDMQMRLASSKEFKDQKNIDRFRAILTEVAGMGKSVNTQYLSDIFLWRVMRHPTTGKVFDGPTSRCIAQIKVRYKEEGLTGDRIHDELLYQPSGGLSEVATRCVQRDLYNRDTIPSRVAFQFAVRVKDEAETEITSEPIAIDFSGLNLPSQQLVDAWKVANSVIVGANVEYEEYSQENDIFLDKSAFDDIVSRAQVFMCEQNTFVRRSRVTL